MSNIGSELHTTHLHPLLAWLATLTDYVLSDSPDLTNRQMAVMLVIHLLPGPHTVRGLASRLQISRPVVTRVLDTLSNLGLLRRQKDEKDLRSIFIEQMPLGVAFMREFAELIERNDRPSTIIF